MQIKAAPINRHEAVIAPSVDRLFAMVQAIADGNENERSIIAAALDEALRDQVKRLFAVLAMLMVDDGGSNVARDKAENASPPDRWCPIARAATPSVRSDRRDLTRRGKWG